MGRHTIKPNDTHFGILPMRRKYHEHSRGRETKHNPTLMSCTMISPPRPTLVYPIYPANIMPRPIPRLSVPAVPFLLGTTSAITFPLSLLLLLRGIGGSHIFIAAGGPG